VSDIRESVKKYIDDGWAVVPVRPGLKKASTSWTRESYGLDDFGPQDNIALKCGEPSGWRVDVDCDAFEAVEGANLLLPETGFVHGREGKLYSHHWFHCEGIKTTQFTDIKQGDEKPAMIIEIRSTGGYTVVPPGTWTSKDTARTENLIVHKDRDLLNMAPDDLADAVRNVAIAALLARHWPAHGSRHVLIGPLTGFLLRGGCVDALPVVMAAAKIAGDSDLDDRRKSAEATVAKFRKGEKVTGGPTLTNHLPDEVVRKMRSWLKVADGDAVEAMNDRHFWVRLGKDDCVGRVDTANGLPIFQRPRALYSEYANKFVQVGVDKNGEPKMAPLFETWLKSPARRSYREVVFAPPPHKAEEVDFNLWQGFALEPRSGECPLLLAHLADVICAGVTDHFEYLMNWLAYMVQQPGVPAEVAVMFRGDPGAGKGIFIRAMGSLFGPHFAHLDNTKDLVGFNSLISAKVCVFADEAFWAGDKANKSIMKRIISEPTLRITRKGIDSVIEPNCLHLFFASNEEWVYNAMLKERRIFALEVSPDRAGDFAYFEALNQEMETGGLNAFLAQLLTRSVTAKEIRQVPKTKELRHQQLQSLEPHFEWWYERLFEGCMRTGARWPDKMAVDDLYQAYEMWFGQHSAGRRKLNKIAFGMKMNPLVSGQPAEVRTGTRRLVILPLSEARRRFDCEMGTEGQWEPDPQAQGILV
jgi:hypothetical protein